MKKNTVLLERLNKILEISELDLTDLNDLATKSGILPNTLSQAIRRGKLGKGNVTKIHDKLGVNPEYLREGKLPIIVKKVHSPQKGEQPAIFDDPVVKKYLDGYIGQIDLYKKLLKTAEDEIARLKGLL
jgi:hypothetical protein